MTTISLDPRPPFESKGPGIEARWVDLVRSGLAVNTINVKVLWVCGPFLLVLWTICALTLTWNSNSIYMYMYHQSKLIILIQSCIPLI